MSMKDDIARVMWCDKAKCKPDYLEARQRIIEAVERMAMYEWWWDIMVDEAEKYGIADIPCFVYPLDSEQYERVMKAWRENT